MEKTYSISGEIMKVYVTLACLDYEESTVLLVFKDENKAKEFVDQCNNYQKNRPNTPETIINNEKNHEEWEKYYDDLKIWEFHHPSCDYYADSFKYIETNYIE
jgi:hypothetical protein